MMDDGGDDGEDEFRERIRSAVAESAERELVDVDLSGPQVTVVVDEFSVEDEDRTLDQRALYAVQNEPNVNLSDESEPVLPGEHLNWSYLGPVERTDDGWERVEE